MRSLGELCSPPVFVDGLLMPRDSSFDVNDLITSEQIEGIEIYRNYITAPLDLQMQAARNASAQTPMKDLTCGLIAFWTRGPQGRRITTKRLILGAGVLAAMLLVTR